MLCLSLTEWPSALCIYHLICWFNACFACVLCCSVERLRKAWNKLVELTLMFRFKVLTWRTWPLTLFPSYALRSQTSQSRNIKKLSSSNRRSIWIKLSRDRSRSYSILQFKLRVLYISCFRATLYDYVPSFLYHQTRIRIFGQKLNLRRLETVASIFQN